MEITLYQVDAFASTVFTGNPAAVCPLREWLPESLMQSIARENNLSETAFFVPENDALRIRWFTPEAEVDLCGHATLASAYVILTLLDAVHTRVSFLSRSGTLGVSRTGDLFAMDFPAQPPAACEVPAQLLSGLGAQPEAVLCSEDYFAVFAHEEDILNLKPDMNALASLGLRGVIATAPGREADFVSRFFAPGIGIPEDPVTGSAHCALTPYWSRRLGKKELHARQISRRGGEIFCRDLGERVEISGRAVLYMQGTIFVRT
jgi:PhzF family phenazine biosynthesis protein